MLTKVLFRVAHQWATHIDIDEYIDLLNKIYDRIICYKQVFTKGDIRDIHPTITVSFPELEKQSKDKEKESQKEKTAENNEWLECGSNESNKSEFEYKYEDNNLTPLNWAITLQGTCWDGEFILN